MSRVNWMTGAGVLCAAIFAANNVSLGNTIQPILQSVTPGAGGTFTYVYDLQLTPNNGLTAAGNFPSSLTIVDFGTVTGTPTLSIGAGDITATSAWQVSVNAQGAPSLPNASLASNVLTIQGSGNSASAPDTAGLQNITVKYVGSGLNTVSSQTSLVTLTIVSNFSPGPIVQTLSMNTALGIGMQADTFPMLTVPGGGGPGGVPLPMAAWPGLGMIGGLGIMGMVRRRRNRVANVN